MGKLAKKIIPKSIRKIINKKQSNVKKYLNSQKIFYLTKMGPIEVHGNKMYLQNKSYQSDCLLNRGFFERLGTKLVLDKIKKEEVVIDLGANIGYYTLLFAKIVGNKGKVFAFEPDPDNFKFLKKNVDKNNFMNVQLEQKAVSNTNGTIKLFLNDGNKGAHRIYHSELAGNEYKEVKVTTLDSFFKKMKIDQKVDFIKMDIEGAEFGALNGMKNLLDNNPSITLFLEFDPKQIRAFGSDPMDIIDFLKQNNFKILKLNLEDSINNYLVPFDYNLQLGVNLVCVR